MALITVHKMKETIWADELISQSIELSDLFRDRAYK